jgi:hypothetical protein
MIERDLIVVNELRGEAQAARSRLPLFTSCKVHRVHKPLPRRAVLAKSPARDYFHLAAIIVADQLETRLGHARGRNEAAPMVSEILERPRKAREYEKLRKNRNDALAEPRQERGKRRIEQLAR